MLAESERRELVAAAVAAPSIHNTQPWKFRFTGNLIEVHSDPERELPAEDPDRRMLYLTMGAAVFNLRVAAAHLRHDMSVRGVFDPKRPTRIAEIELTTPGAEAAQLNSLFNAIWRRRTNRNPFLDLRVAHDIRRLLGLSAELEGAELQWVDDRSRLHFLLMMTAAADIEDDYDPARTTERQRWVGGRRDAEGVPSSALGPRSSRRASGVRDLAAAPADANRPTTVFEAKPQLAVLSTEHDRPADWLAAGQALERVLLEATAHGVATSLLNQAIEHRQMRWLVRDPLGAWNRPQAVIRFGYGPDVPPTPRRPLDEFILS